MRKLAFLACASFVSLCLFAADHYMIGHSLVNHQMPRMIQQLADDAGQPHSYRASIMGGASLKWQWENPHLGEGGAHNYNDLATGQYNALLLTDQVPLKPSFQWNKTADYANYFVSHALASNSDLTVYLYQTWPHLDPTKWIESDWDSEIATDLPLWEAVADQLDADYSLTATTKIVPGAAALQALRDAINQGTVPGLNAFEDVFADQIHMNNTGNYFIACVFYGTYFEESPEGLTGRIYNEYGGIQLDLDPTLAQRLQEIAWQVVQNYPRSAPAGGDGGDGGGDPTATATAQNDAYNMASMTSKAGLVGYWPFDESAGSSTIEDVSGQASFGVPVNMAANQLGVAGRFGQSAYFDGQNDYMDFTGAHALMPEPPFTISLWYKGEATSRAPLLASGFDYGNRLGFRIEGFERSSRPRPRWRMGDGSRGWTVYGQNITPDIWHHLAVSYDGSDARLYVDGVFVSNRTIREITYDLSNGICIGADLRGGYFYRGQIDELQVYERALAANEVSHLAYASPTLQVPAPGVLGNDQHSQANPIALLVSPPANGTLSLNSDGSFTYRPDFGFSGQDQFTYRLETTDVVSEPATVTLTVD